jgi:hypothetical protein
MLVERFPEVFQTIPTWGKLFLFGVGCLSERNDGKCLFLQSQHQPSSRHSLVCSASKGLLRRFSHRKEERNPEKLAPSCTVLWKFRTSPAKQCQMEEISFQSVIPDFRSGVAENCPFLGYNRASSDNFLPTFRYNISVPSSGYWGWNNLQFLFDSQISQFVSILKTNQSMMFSEVNSTYWENYTRKVYKVWQN